MFANETEWLKPVIIPLFGGYITGLHMGGNVVQANFVQFNNDFLGLVEFGMFLQCAFQVFCYRVSAQAQACADISVFASAATM